MTEFYLDADGPIDGAAAKAAGATGVVRYVGIGSGPKRLTQSELDDLLAHGLDVLGVAESTTAEANTGYAGGVSDAKAVLADPVAAGLRVIFATNDQTTYSVSDVQYVRGFRDTLGLDRTGAYGFAPFLAAVNAVGYASAFWQCGEPPSKTGTAGFVNFWQRQGTPGTAADGPATPTTLVVAGRPCDISNMIRPVAGGGGTAMSVGASWDYIDQGAGEASAILPVGDNSTVVARAWVSATTNWGSPAPIPGVVLTALDNAGKVLAQVTEDVAWNVRTAALELPNNTAVVTVGWKPVTGVRLIPGLEALPKSS